MVDLSIKLPEGFLNKETRCGFTVSEKLKEVWAVELDLLSEFDRVCKKYGIKYHRIQTPLLFPDRGYRPWIHALFCQTQKQ